MGLEIALNGLIWLLPAACVAICLWLALRSLPHNLRREITEAVDDWHRVKAQLQVLSEQMADQADTLGKRSARVTAENRRADQRAVVLDDTHSAGGDLVALRRKAGLI